MAHPKDIGLAITEALEPFGVADDLIFKTHDWDADEPIDTHTGSDSIAEVDASHGFDNLIITTSDGDQFRVLIQRM